MKGTLKSWLYDYLLKHEGPLPRATAIGRASGTSADGWAVCQALQSLATAKLIGYRRGTRSVNRGHQAIRIVATGKVLKTAGCPFDPPEKGTFF